MRPIRRLKCGCTSATCEFTALDDVFAFTEAVRALLGSDLIHKCELCKERSSVTVVALHRFQIIVLDWFPEHHPGRDSVALCSDCYKRCRTPYTFIAETLPDVPLF